MIGYTDRQWAQAVVKDWMKSDYPVDLFVAQQLRKETSRQTVRTRTQLHWILVGLPKRDELMTDSMLP